MSTTIRRHPDSATLMSFAAGALSEPLAAACSAHASMCSECRDELRDMTLIGAALLGSAPTPGAQVAAPDALEPPLPERGVTRREGIPDPLPAPITQRYGLALGEIPWTRVGPGVWQHRLALSAGVEGELYLIKLAPGCRLPVHGHGGSELTLVITGAFSDASGEFRRGDLQDVDSDTEHQPVGDKEEGCVCLIAAEGPHLLKR